MGHSGNEGKRQRLCERLAPADRQTPCGASGHVLSHLHEAGILALFKRSYKPFAKSTLRGKQTERRKSDQS